MSKSRYAVAALGITLILTSVIVAGGTNGGAVRDTIWPSVALEVGAGILLGVVFVWLERRIETRVAGRLDPLRSDCRPCFRAIRKLLQGANLDGEVRARAVDIFTQLAEAEGRVHGIARMWRVPVPLATDRATG